MENNYEIFKFQIKLYYRHANIVIDLFVGTIDSQEPILIFNTELYDIMRISEYK